MLELLPGQRSMLQTAEFDGNPPWHLLFTAEVTGVPASAVAAGVERLVRRHESLRTFFLPADPGTGRYGRRVLESWLPEIRRQVIRPAPGADPIAQVNGQLDAASTRLLRPFERPPVHFAITRAEVTDRHPTLLVSLLAHQAILDRWAVGTLFTELAEGLAGAGPALPAPSPGIVLAQHRQHRSRPEWRDRLRRQAQHLQGAPTVLELPTDLPRPSQREVARCRLPGTLSAVATGAWGRITDASGCTRAAALLAAYALVLGRRADQTDLVIGIPALASRHADPQPVVGLCSQIVPVRCRLDDSASGLAHVAATGRAISTALDGADLPFEELVATIRPDPDQRRHPLVQFVLDADDPVPETIHCGPVELRIHEGYCGASPFDASLNVQCGGDRPGLVLDYAASALTSAEAADLLDSVDATLSELAEGLAEPLAKVRTLSASQRRRLETLRHGPALPSSTDAADIWSMVLATATAHPDTPAVGCGQIRLTYGELVWLVRAQAADLAAAGVRDGDPVLIALPRGAAEAIVILAVLSLGAHYVAVDPATPEARLRTVLKIVPPAAMVAGADSASRAFAERVAAVAARPLTLMAAIEPDSQAASGDAFTVDQPPIRPDGDRVAYIAFTSGSTGVPKAVRVPHRAVARLVLPGRHTCVNAGPGQRMLRLAPLAFDASTLELFAPLVAGGCLEVYPPGLIDPASLSQFLADRQVTALWLTAGLFRLVADFTPDGFAGVRHVLTGGDVVPPEHVRALLTRFPHLRVSNGYGPTENTTFSTVAHFDEPAEVRDPLPIGRAIAGSGVLVVDQAQGIVPPGGMGELYVSGLGLALDYAGAPEQTAAAFGRMPDSGERSYRTGDLVRFDGDGQLRYLGRRDHQVKIRGFRIELDEIRKILLGQPGVRDAVVITVGADASARRLLAALIPQPEARIDLDGVASRVSGELPAHAVPSLWALIREIPITGNGKVDAPSLEAIARPLGEARRRPPVSDGPPANEAAAERTPPSALSAAEAGGEAAQ
jgi:amino acid adenylation domain-containing protein